MTTDKFAKGKTVHMSMSIRGALSWDKRTLKRWSGAFTASDGTIPTPAEVREFLMDELSKGHELLPMSDACVGFDFKTGCPGHPTENNPPTDGMTAVITTVKL